MDYSKTTSFIYEKCAERIKKAINESEIKLDEIDAYNPKLISMIQNNRRVNSRNRYLITDTARDSLVKNLPFDDEVHLLWGTAGDRKTLVLPIFIYLISDSVFDSEIDNILQAYVPYARCRTYFKLLFQTENKYPAFQYGIREDDIMNEIDMARYLASIFVYSECKDQIASVILDFMDRTKSFKKLPRKLHDFIETELMNVLRDYRKVSHATGYRVEELILGDVRFLPEVKSDENNVTEDLIKATKEYLERLENIQKEQMEKVFNTTFAHLLDVDKLT